MNAEESVSAQQFLPFPRSVSRSKEAALEELTRPCGQFRSPFTLEEKTRTFISKNLVGIDMLSNVTEVIAPGTPLNWQAVLRYLYEKNVITEAQFNFSPISNDLPKSYRVGLNTRWDESKNEGLKVNKSGYSHSGSIEMALSKAVGETLERSLLSTYTQNELIRASYNNLVRARKPAVNIFEMNSFVPWQEKRRPRFKRSQSAPLYWVLGETIEGEGAYLPAQSVFWNYDLDKDVAEQILAHPTTSGSGGYFTKAGAVLSGLLELIERDAFIIHWLNGISPPSIDRDSIKDEEVQVLLSSCERYGLEMHFLNTTSDIGIPCVSCALVDPRADSPMLSIGSAAGFTIKDTLLHAGYEALAVLDSTIQTPTFILTEPYEPFTDSRVGRMQRLAIWRGHKMMERFSFFIAGKKQSAKEFIGDTPQEESKDARLQFVLDALAKKGPGYEVYLYEVKNEVLATLGYHVVHTLVPKLIPIYLNEHLATLNSKRLKEVPDILGHKSADTLIPWPHPFP